MENWFELIFFIVMGLFALLSWLRKQIRRQPESQAALEDEQEVTLPPWGNLPPVDDPASQLGMEEELPAPPTETETPVVGTAHDAPSERESPQAGSGEGTATSQSDRDARHRQPDSTKIATIAGIPLTHQTYRQGIILYEILRLPKSRRGSSQSDL